MKFHKKPLSKQLILVGGGHTHALFLQKLIMNPIERLSVLVISPSSESFYSGMLPGYIAGIYKNDELKIDIMHLAHRSDSYFIQDIVTEIWAEKNTVVTKNHGELQYDLLSIDIGSKPKGESKSQINPANEKIVSIPVKPIDEFLGVAEKWFESNGKATEKGVSIVGGGPAGIELACALSGRFGASDVGKKLEIKIFERHDAILKNYSKVLRKKVLKTLRNLKVKVNTGISAENSEELPCKDNELVIWVNGVRPIFKGSGTDLPLIDGFFEVNLFLQSTQFSNVFAVGDCSSVRLNPWQKSGVYAVRQGEVLFQNIQNYMAGKPPIKFRPQSHFLKILLVSKDSAIGEKFGIAFQGKWVYRLKDYIDLKFMNKFRVKTTTSPEDVYMPCSGCAAKIESNVIADPSLRKEINALEGGWDIADNSDYAVTNWIGKDGDGCTLVENIDFFPAVINNPLVNSRISIQHAAKDVITAEISPQKICLVNIYPNCERLVAKNFNRLVMRGVLSEAKKMGAQVSAIHTSKSEEWGMAIHVQSKVSGEKVVESQPRGQGKIYLFGKIGIGVYLSAWSRGLLLSSELLDALEESMQNYDLWVGQKLISRQSNSSFMTDVTGFGLAGHIIELSKRCSLRFDLHLEAVPTFRLFNTLVAKGIRSSADPGNRQSYAHAINIVRGEGQEDFNNWQRDAALYDPQTNGAILVLVEGNSMPPSWPENIRTKMTEIGDYSHPVSDDANRFIIH